MDFMSFLSSMKWEVLKNALLKQGIEPHKLEWVDFNNIEQINKLAEQIWPELVKRNPFIASLIKQNSSMMGDKGKEMVEVINKV